MIAVVVVGIHTSPSRVLAVCVETIDQKTKLYPSLIFICILMFVSVSSTCWWMPDHAMRWMDVYMFAIHCMAVITSISVIHRAIHSRVVFLC